jgi:hypothetical protein
MIFRRIELRLESLDKCQVSIKGETIGEAFMALSGDADRPASLLLQSFQCRTPELTAGDLFDAQRFGTEIQMQELIGEEIVLQQMHGRLGVGFQDVEQLGEDSIQEGADASPVVSQVLTQLVIGDGQLVHGIGVGAERFVAVEGAPLSNGGDEKGILGVCMRKLQVHHGSGMVGAERRDEHHRIAAAVEGEGECLPEVTGSLDGKDNILGTVHSDDPGEMAPESLAISHGTCGEGERMPLLGAACIDDRSLMTELGRIDPDHDLATKQLTVGLES